MTPTRSDCIAWLESQGWVVTQKGNRVGLEKQGRTLRFLTVESAYRRLHP